MNLYKIEVEDAVVWDWTYIVFANTKKEAKETVKKEYKIVNTQSNDWTSWYIKKVKQGSSIKLFKK